MNVVRVPSTSRVHVKTREIKGSQSFYYMHTSQHVLCATWHYIKIELVMVHYRCQVIVHKQKSLFHASI